MNGLFFTKNKKVETNKVIRAITIYNFMFCPTVCF